jgi:prepilin-type N-terminal cleavage/methylation domain-containing protein
MKRLAEWPHRLKGFTLLEALIALVVLAVGLLALAQFHAATLLNSADAKARTQATKLAQAKLDKLKNYYALLDFTDLASASTVETASSPSVTDLYGHDWVEGFERHWRVWGEYIRGYTCDGTYTDCGSPPCLPCPCAAETDPDPLTDLTPTDSCHQKRIQVTVEWTDAKNVHQEINVESIIERVEPVWSGQILRP